VCVCVCVCVCVGWLVVLACLTSNRKSTQLFQAFVAIMLYISCISLLYVHVKLQKWR
jgi:hypothetical protein